MPEVTREAEVAGAVAGAAAVAEEAERTPAAPAPEKVVFVDIDTDVITETALAEVPESIAWVTVNGQRLRVTRVESQNMGADQREIRSYGADGALLATTLLRAAP